MSFCVAADTPVLFNCFRISGSLTSVVKRVGDDVEWVRWEGSVGPFAVLVLMVVELSFSWPWSTTIGLASWVVHILLPPLSVCIFLSTSGIMLKGGKA